MKRFISLLLSIVLVFTCVTTAYAFPGFSRDEETTKNGFASEYNWDLEAMDADEWVSAEDGETYRRTTSHQREHYEDAFKSAEDYALELGIITSRMGNGGGYGGYQIAEVAKAEVGTCEEPMGSNAVKYNDWYYGRHAFGDDYPWCAVFVSWCADQCGFIESGLFNSSAGVSNIRDYHLYVNGFREYYAYEITQFGGSAYTAKVGDIAIINDGGHIGIVTDVADDKIEIVDGNCADQVVCSWADRNSERTPHMTIIEIEYPMPEYYGAAFEFNGDTKAILYEVYWYARTQMGLNNAAIAALCGNIQNESGFNPWENTGDYGTSCGLFQWHAERKHRLFQMCNSVGLDPFDPDVLAATRAQMWYLSWELKDYGHYSGTWDALIGASNTADGAYYAADYFCRYFESPANVDFQASQRGWNAKDTYFPMFSQGMTRTPNIGGKNPIVNPRNPGNMQ